MEQINAIQKELIYYLDQRNICHYSEVYYIDANIKELKQELLMALLPYLGKITIKA